jgi:hypothetical protein
MAAQVVASRVMLSSTELVSYSEITRNYATTRLTNNSSTVPLLHKHRAGLGNHELTVAKNFRNKLFLFKIMKQLLVTSANKYVSGTEKFRSRNVSVRTASGYWTVRFPWELAISLHSTGSNPALVSTQRRMHSIASLQDPVTGSCPHSNDPSGSYK